MPRPRDRSDAAHELLRLLRQGDMDGAALVEALGLPRRTLTRLMTDLRKDGHRIVAVRDCSSWSYRLESTAAP